MEEKILIVDDDHNIAELINIYLKKEGYVTRKEHNGRKAVEAFASFAPNMVLLDIMLPEMDGYAVCREIRKSSGIPIIMMTAKGETFDKVLGLELGADDYIVKPFDMKEVIARIKAVLRRYDHGDVSTDKLVVIPNLSVNATTYTVLYKGNRVELPPKEFELLYCFVTHTNQVLSREQLLDKIWGYEFAGDTRTIDVHVKRLREKFADEEQWGIKTIWGVGYKFEVNI